jgi:uncharacterized protein YqhQ
LHLGLAVQSPLFQVLTGAFKVALVVGLMLWMRRIPEFRRMLQYHGAEHKAVSTYEAGEPLTVENARRKTTLHPRCGTTFSIMVALVSILVFTAIGAILPRIATGSTLLDNVVFFLEKLPFLPLLVGITFELQRFFARNCTTGPLRAVLVPGFVVQGLTTAEPDDSQLEVALASLHAALIRQKGGCLIDGGGSNGSGSGAGADSNGGDVRFPDYASLVAASALRPAA